MKFKLFAWILATLAIVPTEANADAYASAFVSDFKFIVTDLDANDGRLASYSFVSDPSVSPTFYTEIGTDSRDASYIHDSHQDLSEKLFDHLVSDSDIGGNSASAAISKSFLALTAYSQNGTVNGYASTYSSNNAFGGLMLAAKTSLTFTADTILQAGDEGRNHAFFEHEYADAYVFTYVNFLSYPGQTQSSFQRQSTLIDGLAQDASSTGQVTWTVSNDTDTPIYGYFYLTANVTAVGSPAAVPEPSAYLLLLTGLLLLPLFKRNNT